MGLASAIGAAVGGVGSLISSSSNRSAANRAAESSENNNAENVALAREIYGNNQQVLSPFVNRGNAAGSQINALLGLPTAPQQQTQPNALSQFAGNPSGPVPFGGAGAPYGIGDYAGLGRFSGDITGSPNQLAQLSQFFNNPIASTQTGLVQPTTEEQILNQSPQESAFDTFRNSTGYKFRLGEGLDAVGSAYAGIGGLQSGAAQRALTEYGQNFASNEFGNYMNALSNQQAVGAGTASSLAGVGQNFAGTVINSNNLNTANQMNAQLTRGANNPLASFAGAIGGGLFQAGL